MCIRDSLYFVVNPPEGVAVIYGDKDGLVSFVSKINKYKKQYDIRTLCSITNENIKQTIRDHQTIFMYALKEADKARIQMCIRDRISASFFIDPCIWLSMLLEIRSIIRRWTKNR